MTLPADSHVHSEWSWDTGGPHSDAAGRMRATCARAVRIGLPALFFTEHLDIPGAWRADAEDLLAHQRRYLDADDQVQIDPLDAAGYLDAIDRMRHAFPDLRIGTGVEFGQPHRWGAEAAAIVDVTRLDRVLGSLHVLDMGDGPAEPVTLFRTRAPDDVMRAYLAELAALALGTDLVEVVTHVDYAVRSWPAEEHGPFDPRRFEGEFRAAMRTVADAGLALEMNTRRLWPWIPQWWAQEGGGAVSFGSDAHVPAALAANFPEATAMLEAVGFRPGRTPEELWRRGVAL